MAEAGLHEREALLRSIYDASSAAIFLVDMNGRITHANHRMSELFGRPMDDLIGSDYTAWIAPAERDAVAAGWAPCWDPEMPSVNLERVYYRQDKTVFWGLLTGRPLRNSKGAVCGLVGVIADVTTARRPKPAWRSPPASSKPATKAFSSPTPSAASSRSTWPSPPFPATRRRGNAGQDLSCLASKRAPNPSSKPCPIP